MHPRTPRIKHLLGGLLPDWAQTFVKVRVALLLLWGVPLQGPQLCGITAQWNLSTNGKRRFHWFCIQTPSVIVQKSRCTGPCCEFVHRDERR
jgi:hypothetical protein